MSEQVMVVLPEGANEWLLCGARGISSEAIFSVMTGLKLSGGWGLRPPSDPSDFIRCEKLLRAVPDFRLRLGEMSKVSRVWAGLVAEWDSLVTLLDEEAPEWEHGQGRCYKTYAAMQRIYAGGAS